MWQSIATGAIMLVIHRRRRVAGGYLYKCFIIWRNKQLPLGAKGAWHVFVKGKKRDFKTIQEAKNNVDTYLNFQNSKKIKF
jgi:hypothetical protein